MVAVCSFAQATSGKCGENLTWSFDSSSGTLTISGTGEMNNYDLNVSSTGSSAPWIDDFSNQIEQVIIEDGVISIGNWAFYPCENLIFLTIPNSITSIGAYAFTGCISLASITIPESVTSIGASAFQVTAWYNNQPDGVIYINKYCMRIKEQCLKIQLLRYKMERYILQAMLFFINATLFLLSFLMV